MCIVMNFDFHTHGKLTKYDEFSIRHFRSLIKAAKESGLDGFALTEHFNTRHFFDVFGTLDEFYPYEDGYYLVDGLRVFPGMEVHTRELEHILLIGSRVAIRSLRMQLQPYTHKLNYIPIEKLLELTASQDVLLIAGHPVIQQRDLFTLEPHILDRLDAIEMNGQDLRPRSIEENASEVERLGIELNKMVLGGSGAFHRNHFGKVFTKFDISFSTIRELRALLEQGAYTVKVMASSEKTFLQQQLTAELGAWSEPYL